MSGALTPADVEAIALAVVANAGGMLAEQRQRPDIVDAAELAEILKVEREWIYDNAERLGGYAISNGPRPRLRFDVREALAACRLPRPRGARRARAPTPQTPIRYKPRR